MLFHRSLFVFAITGLLLLSVNLGTQSASVAQPDKSQVSGAIYKPYVVRVAYIVPSDRKPLYAYRTKAGMLLGSIQTFYADQMERNGFGRMTFTYEKSSDGLPAIQLIRSPMTAAEFAGTGHAKYAMGNYWQHTEDAMKGAGFPVFQPGEIWVCIVDAQDQLPDGSIHNGTAQGNCRFESGMLLCSADTLALADPALLHDHRPYGGLILPELGPNPLVLHKSFAEYEGDDVSSLVAVHIGAVAHELGHAFTLQHCYLNDLNFNGNLMGNSFRGWRGYAMPDQFPDEETRLDRPSALMLSVNPFFRSLAERVPRGRPPVVSITMPPGDMPVEQGNFRLPFTASQPGGPGIALAILQCAEPRDNVGVVAYKAFDGKATEVSGTMETTLVTLGKEEHWTLRVFDNQGRWSDQTVLLKAPTEGLAPIPFIFVPHTTVKAGESVKLDAHLTRGASKFHWEFGEEGEGANADGRAVTHIYTKPGSYEVKLTASDGDGRHSEITQIIRVRAAQR